MTAPPNPNQQPSPNLPPTHEILPQLQTPELGGTLSKEDKKRVLADFGKGLNGLEVVTREAATVAFNQVQLERDNEGVEEYLKLVARQNHPDDPDIADQNPYWQKTTQHHREATNKADAALENSAAPLKTLVSQYPHLLKDLHTIIEGASREANRAATKAAAADQKAGKAVIDERYYLAEMREALAEQQLRPEPKEPPKPESKVTGPFGFIERRKLRKEAEAYDEASAKYKKKMDVWKNEFGEPATEFAEAAFDAYSAASQRHRALSGERVAATKAAVLKEVYDEIQSQRRAAITELTRFRDGVDQELEKWAFMAPGAPNQASYIASGLRMWSTLLEPLPLNSPIGTNQLSIYDPERHKFLGDWVLSTVRLAQRHIMGNESTTYAPVPRFTEDGGILMSTLAGEQILYEDRSMASKENGEWVRRNTDGTLWEPPKRELGPDRISHSHLVSTENPIDRQVRDLVIHTSKDDLLTQRNAAFKQWERTRTAADARKATPLAWASHEKLQGELIEEIGNHAAAVEARDNAKQAAEDTKRNREQIIQERIDALDPLLRNDDAAKAQIRTSVNDYIAQLEKKRDEAVVRAENLKTTMDATCAETSQALYWKYRFSVNYPNETGVRPGFVTFNPDGSLHVRDTVLNISNKRGDWDLRPNGSATLHNPDGTTTEYTNTGEIV